MNRVIIVYNFLNNVVGITGEFENWVPFVIAWEIESWVPTIGFLLIFDVEWEAYVLAIAAGFRNAG